jgi:DNA repair exonuclease SbcCD nuclease subunit
VRIAVFSDVHLDARTAGVARLPEIRDFIDGMVVAMRQEGVDAAICLGDLYDPGGDDLAMATELAGLVARVHGACGRSLWIAGNHDVHAGGLTTLSPLATLAAVIPELHVAERPRLVAFGDVLVLCLPHPGRDGTAFRAEVQHVVDLAAAAAGAGAPIVVASHLSLLPAWRASESEELARGTDVPMDVAEVMRCRPGLVLNGHYHAGQVVRDGAVEIHIPGSPLRYRFDEREDGQKGFFIVDT